MDAPTRKFAKKLGMINSRSAKAHIDAATKAEIEERVRAVRRKMDAVFTFLANNSSYNRHTQHMSYVQMLRPWTDTGDKLRSLLYATSETQAKGSLDDISETWKRLYHNKQTFAAVRTSAQLTEALGLLGKPSNSSGQKVKRLTPTLDAMWKALRSAQGFGEKMAALFVKAIVDIHTLEVNTDLRFLENFNIDPSDFIRVPVDSVITYIFQRVAGRQLNFMSINDLIFKVAMRSNTEAATWDDLWFWGFITQHGGGEKRKLDINEAKFWSLHGSPKEQWPEIRLAAQEFIDIIEMVM